MYRRCMLYETYLISPYDKPPNLSPSVNHVPIPRSCACAQALHRASVETLKVGPVRWDDLLAGFFPLGLAIVRNDEPPAPGIYVGLVSPAA
jgi:hypothetical protein